VASYALEVLAAGPYLLTVALSKRQAAETIDAAGPVCAGSAVIVSRLGCLSAVAPRVGLHDSPPYTLFACRR
jgi:hypothetical protein